MSTLRLLDGGAPNAAVVSPIWDPSIRGLCVRPYPGHNRGCPNYGRRLFCPPEARLLSNVIELERPCFCIWNRFDLCAHVDRMTERHPTWSHRQLYCCLYWQGAARAALKRTVAQFRREHLGLAIVACPEACGVNVTATMATLGIELEWPPLKVAYQVVLAGIPIRVEELE